MNVRAGDRLLRLPDVIAIGPPRTATTWLHQVLRGHAGLQRGPVKETNYFWRETYQRGIEWYADQFSECRSDQPIVEVSPNYFGSMEALERMARDLPGCRIVCSFRDPVERSYSYYKLMRHYGATRLPFPEYVETPPVADANRYGSRLRDWRARFGSENVLTVLYEDLVAAPDRFLDPICDFIGIARIPIADSPLANKRVFHVETDARSAIAARAAVRMRAWLARRGLKRTDRMLRKLGLWRLCLRTGPRFGELEPELVKRLRERMRPEVELLEQLIKRDLSAWM